MNSELLTNKWVIIGALIGLILIFFMGKSYGKSEPPEAININGKTDTDGYLVSNLTNDSIAYLTQRAFDDLEGVNWWFATEHTTELWNEITMLSDYDLARVVNEWNKTFYRKHNEKLSEAIDNDNWAFDNSAGAVTVLNRRIKKLENTK